MLHDALFFQCNFTSGGRVLSHNLDKVVKGIFPTVSMLVGR